MFSRDRHRLIDQCLLTLCTLHMDERCPGIGVQRGGCRGGRGKNGESKGRRCGYMTLRCVGAKSGRVCPPQASPSSTNHIPDPIYHPPLKSHGYTTAQLNPNPEHCSDGPGHINATSTLLASTAVSNELKMECACCACPDPPIEEADFPT